LSNIKRTPTDEEFLNSVKEMEREWEEAPKNKEDFSRIIGKYVAKLTPAKKIFLFFPDPEEDRLFLARDQENRSIVSFKLEQKGLIARSLETGRALYTNDVGRESAYLDSADNPCDYDLKSLLLFPRFDASKRPLLLIWAGIPHKDLNQFIMKDIEHLETMLQKAESFLQRNLSIDSSVSHAYDHSPAKNSENTDSRQDVGTPVLVQVIRSWFHRKKKINDHARE